MYICIYIICIYVYIYIFYRPDGRLVKLLLSSTLVDKSPLTFIYFTTFEKKREARSPLSTQPNFLVFGKISLFLIICVNNYHESN